MEEIVMKPTDLMIGDWVCLKDDVQYESPMKVDGILAHNISLEGEGFLGDADEIISPIPLTAEILEKNGWRHDTTNHMYDIWLHEDVEFNIEKWNGKFICSDDNQIKLYSVHQLQQILRLCGLDGLADNFKV